MLNLFDFSRLNSRMLLSLRTFIRSRFGFLRRALAVVLVAAAAPSLFAQGTHLWTQSRIEEFEKGTPLGVALGSDGHLRAVPEVREVLTSPSTYVWSVAVDKSGTAFLATASPATVLRVASQPGVKPTTLFETRDLSVQVVKLGPDGALYAATLPSGKVYRLNPDATAKQDESSATVVFDAGQFDESKPTNSADSKPEQKAHYIWDLSFDAQGRLYIATGGPGVVYRVDPSKGPSKKEQKPEAFFQCDEQHIRSLAWDAKGNLIAGTDGSGLVYRINGQGKGYVLFEAPRREITAVSVAANGTIYAASVGDKSHNPLPPLPVQKNDAFFSVSQPGSLQAANASTSLPDGSEIFALVEGQAPRKLWSGKDEIVYALAARPDGLLALTGNRGRIFKIQDDGSYADVAHLEAQQGLSLAVVAEKVFITTGNTGKLYSLATDAGKHEYASDVLDAGALARFGRVEVQTGSTGYELLTRTGNVEQPARGRNDWGWSDWQPLLDGGVASPAGRYLQWKISLNTESSVGGVSINYLPVNAAPVVDDVVVVAGARLSSQGLSVGQPQTVMISFAPSSPSLNLMDGAVAPLQAVKDRTAITARWAAHDDNGDDLTFALYLRGDGESVWRLLKNDLTEKAYNFDAALIPDGGYQIKVIASDAPSHTPGEALRGEKISARFEVDTTPPVVNGLKADAKGRIVFDAEDAFSPIAHAEYSLDAGPWQFIEPVGNLSDSRREHYELRLSLPSTDSKSTEHLFTVRVYDRHDNIGVAKTVFATSDR